MEDVSKQLLLITGDNSSGLTSKELQFATNILEKLMDFAGAKENVILYIVTNNNSNNYSRLNSPIHYPYQAQGSEARMTKFTAAIQNPLTL